LTKGTIKNIVLFLNRSTEKHEAETMKSANKQVSTPVKSWTCKVEGRHIPKVDHYSELRSWVQRAILEAERNEAFNKKDQLLSLLKDL
jgi:hypothetical protein